jgi:myo-inositol-1(or 4)-monophosphatase
MMKISTCLHSSGMSEVRASSAAMQQRDTGHTASGRVEDCSFGGVLGQAEALVAIADAAGQMLHARFGDPGLVSAKGVVSDSGRVFDVVTELDMQCEALITERIRALSPHATLLAEEGGVTTGEPADASREAVPERATSIASAEDLWVIDPLDGTLNFAAGIPLCAVSIGRYQRGKIIAGVIHAPMIAETWTIDETGPRCNGRPIRVAQEQFTHETLLAAGGAGRSFGTLAGEFRSWRRLGSAALSLAWVAGGRLGAYVQLGSLHPWDTAVGAPLVLAAGGVVTDQDFRPWTPRFDGPTGMIAGNPSLHQHVADTLQSHR